MDLVRVWGLPAAPPFPEPDDLLFNELDGRVYRLVDDTYQALTPGVIVDTGPRVLFVGALLPETATTFPTLAAALVQATALVPTEAAPVAVRVLDGLAPDETIFEQRNAFVYVTDIRGGAVAATRTMDLVIEYNGDPADVDYRMAFGGAEYVGDDSAAELIGCLPAGWTWASPGRRGQCAADDDGNVLPWLLDLSVTGGGTITVFWPDGLLGACRLVTPLVLVPD